MLTSSYSLDISTAIDPTTITMASGGQLPGCHISQVDNIIKDLEYGLEILSAHTTIKLGLSHCKKMLSMDNISNASRRLAALEFLGATSALCGCKDVFEQTEFHYSNVCQGIFWRLSKAEAFNFQKISAKLWDPSVDQARRAYIHHLTCHHEGQHNSNDYNIFEHFENIEQSIQQDLNEFNNRGGSLTVKKWISNQSGFNFESPNNEPAAIAFLYNIAGDPEYEINFEMKSSAPNMKSTTTDSKLDSAAAESKILDYDPAIVQSILNIDEYDPKCDCRLSNAEIEDLIFIPEIVKAAEKQSPMAKVTNNKLEDMKDLLNLPMLSPLSNLSFEDITDSSDNRILLTGSPFSPATRFDNPEQSVQLPTPPRSPKIDDCCVEKREDLATLEATFFFLASAYIKSSNIANSIEELNAFQGVIINFSSVSAYSNLITNEVMEIVHSHTNQYLKAHECDETGTDTAHFDALNRLFSLKKEIDTLRDTIEQHDIDNFNRRSQ